MKTPLRFQSRLLNRRSYKLPRGNARSIRVLFRPAPRMSVPMIQAKSTKPEPSIPVCAFPE